MATRFYLPSTGEAAVTPAFSSWWEDTSQAERHAAVTTKIGSSMLAVENSLDTVGDLLLRQYVSAPLAAQTITAQTVKIQARGWRSYSLSSVFLSWSVRVVSGDGETVRGTLIEQHDGTVFPFGSWQNRRDYGTCAQVVAQAGDRIVIEVGVYHSIYQGDCYVALGDDSGTDLPENDTETNPYNPWVEFSQTLSFGVTLHASPVAVSLVLPAASLALGAVTLHASPLAIPLALPTAHLYEHVSEKFGQHPTNVPVRCDAGSGAPAYSAAAGTLYWDIVSGAFYVNLDGATGWKRIGGPWQTYISFGSEPVSGQVFSP